MKPDRTIWTQGLAERSEGLSANGEICGVTTTSGLAWKIPGRAGDSPILGAGLGGLAFESLGTLLSSPTAYAGWRAGELCIE